MASEQRIYWDADVCLSYLEDWSERSDVIERIANAASQGLVRIVTSAWTVAEVAYLEAEKQLVESPDSAQRIKDFWDSNIIEIQELQRFVAERA